MPHPQRRKTDSNILVQEIEDFLDVNNLDPKDRLMLRVSKHTYIASINAETHIGDNNLHSPKGLLVRTGVITWAIFIMFLVSTIVMYIPEGIAWLKALP